jgi:hypothetical protein
MPSKRTRSPIQFVYFIRSENFVKVGWATALDTRFNNCQINNPHPVELMAFFRGGREEEACLHACFSPYHHRGEWFVYADPIQELVGLIKGLDPIEARIAAGQWYFDFTGYGSLRPGMGVIDAMRGAEHHAANVR